MMMRRRLACCTREREFSIDYDEQERITTYNGLESCIIDSRSYDNQSGTSRGDEFVTDSFDGDDASSCSSSNNASGSFSSLWTIMKKDDQSQDEWTSASPHHCHSNDKLLSNYITDVETMKEKFAKLLLGDDVSGGSKGICTALALSNAISNLAASVFGELWKLEPLAEEIKCKWRTEMDWLLSPTNYMIELVPSKQNAVDGRTLEIMTPKARADVFLNLPALQKLDSMLIETLDSMVGTEFWYDETGSKGEGRSKNGVEESKRWWLPSPRVPIAGLSDVERKRLLHEGKLVFQVFKAAKSINENVLDVMPIPMIVRDTLQKSGKANLGEELYKILTAESISADEMVNCMYLNSEHSALEAINKLEAAIFVWKERMTEHSSGKSPVRTQWFVKEPTYELDTLLTRAQILLQHIKSKHPNLPKTFLDVTKVQYNKDVGHSIIEAYSRILANLAFRILSRVGDVLQEDVMSTPNSPVAMSRIVGARIPGISDSPLLDRVRHSLIRQLNSSISGDVKSKQQEEAKIYLASASPSGSKVWCVGNESCRTISAQNSP